MILPMMLKALRTLGIKGRRLNAMQVSLNAHFTSFGSARGALSKNAN
jgi:hypothetical protein